MRLIDVSHRGEPRVGSISGPCDTVPKRRRRGRLVAVEFEMSWPEIGARSTFVWVVENYSASAVRSVIAHNPDVFPIDADWRFRPLLTWHTWKRFYKWAATRRVQGVWMYGVKLAPNPDDAR